MPRHWCCIGWHGGHAGRLRCWWLLSRQILLRWYQDLLDVEVERLEEWRKGEAPFVSLRIDDGTVIDLFAGAEVPGTGIDHIALVVEAECRFDIRFRSDEIEELKNVGELVRLVQAKLELVTA